MYHDRQGAVTRSRGRNSACPGEVDPVRRQGHAPTVESTALPGHIGSPSDPICPGSAVGAAAGFSGRNRMSCGWLSFQQALVGQPATEDMKMSVQKRVFSTFGRGAVLATVAA